MHQSETISAVNYSDIRVNAEKWKRRNSVASKISPRDFVIFFLFFASKVLSFFSERPRRNWESRKSLRRKCCERSRFSRKNPIPRAENWIVYGRVFPNDSLGIRDFSYRGSEGLVTEITTFFDIIWRFSARLNDLWCSGNSSILCSTTRFFLKIVSLYKPEKWFNIHSIIFRYIEKYYNINFILKKFKC